MSHSLPATHRALVLTTRSEPPTVQYIPTPLPGPGSVVVRMELANVISYSRDVYTGVRDYPFPMPLVIGTSGIGRIAAIGPDATAFTPGQLVLVDSFIRARDDPSAAFLLGVHEGHTSGSQTLMRGEWKDATYAEYAKLPLENVYKLDEDRLLGTTGGLGLKLEDLADLSRLAVSMGGLSDIGVKAGETIIIAPATGPFGSAAVVVALALGARVIAMGRNIDALTRLEALSSRVSAVRITGDEAADLKALQNHGTIDAYFDISPPVAGSSTHFKSAILALRHGGRISMMGGIDNLNIPMRAFMHRDLMLRGKWMYTRENMRDLIKMAETGVLKLGGGEVGVFKLDEWDAAFEAAEKGASKGVKALIAP